MTSQRVGFVSLGCPKALVDSERILTQLRIEGYSIVPSYHEAEVVIVNTCGFITSAVEESMEAIGEALAENGRVIVTGCLGVKEKEIRERFPQVLKVTGPQRYEEVVSAVHEALPITFTHDPLTSLVPAQGIKLTPRHYAYLKISEGCNHRCTFCIIPSMRGDLVSRPLSDVMQEAQKLAASGVKELLVIAQDTSAYGLDLKYQADTWRQQEYETRLYDLCQALGELGIWVRLHYVYPYPHVDKIIPLMAEGKILPYLDIPLQHASKRILKLMKRPANTENTLERILRWREICSDITLRSTFIVGFPGETDEDFQELLDFLVDAQLDRVGCFTYSPVPGAKANELPDAVPEEVKQERYREFMQVQAEISLERLEQKIGTTRQVLIDKVTEQGAIGRSWADAPDIDGNVILAGDFAVKPGDLVNVLIEDTDEYDLWGRRV
jgi:ribosomal protein S12 methylthiotransferase